MRRRWPSPRRRGRPARGRARSAAASKASRRVENAPIAPKTSSPATSGATTIERMPMSRDDAVGLGGVRERRVVEVVARSGRPRARRRPARTCPTPTGRSIDADPLPAARAADAGVVGEAEVAGGRVEEVDHRAVGVEEAGGLVDGRDQQLVDLADAAVRIAPAGCRRARSRGGGFVPWRSRSGRRVRRGARRARAAIGSGVATPARIRRVRASGGIAVRRGGYVIRPRRRSSTVDDAATRRATASDRRSLAHRDGRPRRADDAAMTPALSPAPSTSNRGPITDVRLPHRAPPVRRRHPRRDRRPGPGDRLHPLHPRWPAVHPERRRLPRRRRRDDHPARPRRPLPLGRPPRPHRLRRHHDRRLGRPGPVLHDRLHRQGHRGRADRPARRRLRPPRRQPGRGRQARARRLRRARLGRRGTAAAGA